MKRDLSAKDFRRLLRASRYPQTRLAATLEVSDGTVTHWKNGRSKIPPDTAKLIRDILEPLAEREREHISDTLEDLAAK